MSATDTAVKNNGNDRNESGDAGVPRASLTGASLTGAVATTPVSGNANSLASDTNDSVRQARDQADTACQARDQARDMADAAIDAKNHSPSRMVLLGMYAAVICAALFPYLAALRYGFVFDDDVQVLANPAIRAWRFVPAYFVKPIAGFFSGMNSAHYYRPIFFVWLRLNYFLWGAQPRGWHLGSLVLHAVASLLVLGVLRKYFLDTRWAVAAALIFAVHPVHVETVVWISGCTDALMAVSLLGSLFLWMRAKQLSSTWRRVASLVLCGAALLSKETAIILPVLIFVHALAGIPRMAEPEKLPGRWTFALREAAPYAALAAVYLGIRSWVLHSLPPTPEWISRAQALLTVPSLVEFYAQHLAWPFHLSLFYDRAIVARAGSPMFWAPLLAAAGVAVLVWRCYRRTHDARIALAAVWFALPIAPVLYIRLFQRDDFVHDRYLYLPVMAVAILPGLFAEFLWKSQVRRKAPALPLILLVSAVAALALAAMIPVRPWETNLTLYSNAVQVAPGNAIARNNLGGEYAVQGRYNEAGGILEAVLQERPDLWLANYNYGFVQYHLGNTALAEQYLNRAIRIDPADADQYMYLGTTYFKQGRLLNAAQQMEFAIARKPDGTGYHLVLGIIRAQQKDLTSAKQEMEQELKYHPESGVARLQLQAINHELSGVN